MVVNRMRLLKAAISVLLLLLRVGKFELKRVRVLDLLVALVAAVPVGGRVGHQGARIVHQIVVGRVRRVGSRRDVHSLPGAAPSGLLLLKGCFGSGLLVAEDGLEQGRCFLLAERSTRPLVDRVVTANVCLLLEQLLG